MKARFTVIFSLLFLHVFAVQVFFGDQPILNLPEGKLLEWDKFVGLVERYFELMGFEPPVVGNVGNFNYIVWNGHTVGFDSFSKFVSLDGVSKRSEGVDLIETLKIFGLPFVMGEEKLILPNMWIYEIQKVQDVIEVHYGGEERLKVSQDVESILFNSDGYVFYNNRLYPPGQTVARFARDQGESIKQQISFKGLIRLVIGKEFSVSRVRILELSDKPTTINADELVLFYARGDNRVIIRPYVPEYDGVDWPTYAEVRKLAGMLCERFSLKLEICPLIVLPPQTMTMLVLLEDETKLPDLEKFLEELLR